MMAVAFQLKPRPKAIFKTAWLFVRRDDGRTHHARWQSAPAAWSFASTPKCHRLVNTSKKAAPTSPAPCRFPVCGLGGFQRFAVDFTLQRQIRYEFGFAANDGSPYRFAGQNISPLDPVTTLTVLPAYLYDAHGRKPARRKFALRWAICLRFWPVGVRSGWYNSCRQSPHPPLVIA